MDFITSVIGYIAIVGILFNLVTVIPYLFFVPPSSKWYEYWVIIVPYIGIAAIWVFIEEKSWRKIKWGKK